MKFSIEKAIHGTLVLALIIYAFQNFSEHPDVILYRLSEMVVFLTAFFFMAFRWAGDPDKKWSSKKRWSLMAVLWVSSWFLISLTKIVMDLIPDNGPILLEYFFLPHLADNVLGPIISGLIIGSVYGFIRRLIITKEIKKLKILGAVTGTGIIIYCGILLWTLSYSGSDEVLFMDRDQKMTSLREVLSQPELQGKKVYVDFWFATCGPCITAFQNMELGKQLLKENGYVTLYLGRETAGPDSKVRWLSTIRYYDLKGYHVYMSEELEQDVYEQVGKYVDRHFGYPHYLLVNEQGEIINWDAPDILDIAALEASITNQNSVNMAAAGN